MHTTVSQIEYGSSRVIECVRTRALKSGGRRVGGDTAVTPAHTRAAREVVSKTPSFTTPSMHEARESWQLGAIDRGDVSAVTRLGVSMSIDRARGLRRSVRLTGFTPCSVPKFRSVPRPRNRVPPVRRGVVGSQVPDS